MKRRWLLMLVLVVVGLGACETGFSSTPEAPEATIRAYQTRVRHLQSQLDQQHATMAALTPPPGTPVPPPFAKRWKLSISGQATLKPKVGVQDSLTPVAAHGVFLVIPISVTNLTKDPMYFDPANELYVVDGAKRSFDLDPNATGAAYVLDLHGDPSLSTLQPGITYPMVLVFDIPKGDTNLTLKSRDGSFVARVGE